LALEIEIIDWWYDKFRFEGLDVENDDRIIAKAVEHVLRIANERDEILRQLKAAVLENNDSKIKNYAKKICGVRDHESS